MAFSDNIWWTRKARIQTEKRLLANAFQSQVLLLWYSFASVAASIFYLNAENTSNNLAGVSWVVFSVLVLCISGFINGLSFKERAGLIKECYETLNGLYHRAKIKDANIQSLAKEYEQVLGVCENHTDDDYYRALCEAYLTHINPRGKPNSSKNEHDESDESSEDEANSNQQEPPPLDRWPTWYHWLCVFWSVLKRWAMLITLYALPIVIYCALEYIA